MFANRFLLPAYSFTVTGCTFHISSQYSVIARSEENLPLRALLRIVHAGCQPANRSRTLDGVCACTKACLVDEQQDCSCNAAGHLTDVQVAGLRDEPPVLDGVAERRDSAHPEALALARGDLVADASPVTLSSNWARESRMFNINRPMEVVVLNCWVTETKETPWRSKTSIIREKSVSDRVSRSILQTTTMSTLPASMTASRRLSAGRSISPSEYATEATWIFRWLADTCAQTCNI